MSTKQSGRALVPELRMKKGFRGGKEFPLCHSEFLTETPVVKGRLTRENQTPINMHTWEIPREKSVTQGGGLDL